MKHIAPSVCLLLALAPAIAGAGDLYKWQDEDGIWHFGDRPPPDGQAFDTFTVPGEPNRLVSMRQEGPRHQPRYVFRNHTWGPLELELEVTEGINVRSEPTLPARFVLPGQAEQTLVRFLAADPRLGFQYRLRYATVPGPPTTVLPADLDFYPPFPVGLEFTISQGLDDDATHNRPDSRFAVDIAMPVGTPVLAARSGTVMELEDDFQGEGRPDEKYIDRANYVRILHDDGSMGLYAHLQPHSARVFPGERLTAGAWIANSGNTGFSSGPHLHFVVQLNTSMSLESLPFRFRQADGSAVTPDRRMNLGGVLPSL